MTSGASNWNPAKYQVPVKKGLLVQYDPETDILTLWNGTPASNGSSIAKDLVVFYDEEDTPQIVTLENAAALLLPLLGKAG